jgi:hypothetical protein
MAKTPPAGQQSPEARRDCGDGEPTICRVLVPLASFADTLLVRFEEDNS